MLRFYRNCLICLVLLIPVSSFATSRLYDADAVVALRNGNPCFSYPPSGEKLFGYQLNVSKLGVHSTTEWDVYMFDFDNKRLPEPNSPDTCIEYGIVNSEMKVKRAAEPLKPATPYRVFISVAEAPVDGHRYRYLRKLGSEFCICRNEKDETIIVGAEWNDTEGWRCLKPGESPKRGFWQRLFGK